MSAPTTQLIIFLIYKLGSIAVGAFSIYLGYKLFLKGILTNAGDLEADYKGSKFELKKAAPGTFFLLFGVAVIGFTLYKGFGFSETTSTSPSLTDGKQTVTNTKIAGDTMVVHPSNNPVTTTVIMGDTATFQAKGKP